LLRHDEDQIVVLHIIVAPGDVLVEIADVLVQLEVCLVRIAFACFPIAQERFGLVQIDSY
jgi:hypothetical protein